MMTDFAHALGRGPPGSTNTQMNNLNFTSQQQQQQQQSASQQQLSQQHQQQQQQLAAASLHQRMQQQPSQQQPNFQSVSQQQQQQNQQQQQRMGVASMRQVIGQPQPLQSNPNNPQRSLLTLQQQQQQQQPSSSVSSSNPFSSAPSSSLPGTSSSLLGGMHSGPGGAGGFQSEILQSMMKGGAGGYPGSGMPNSTIGGINGQLHPSQQDPNGPRFDMSDFPALSDMGESNKIGSIGAGGGSGLPTTLAGQIALSQQHQQQQSSQQGEQNFLIQNEDFPALGGGSVARRPVSSSSVGGGATAASLLQGRAVGQTQPAGGVNPSAGSSASSASVGPSPTPQSSGLNQPPTQARSGITQRPKSQSCDKYGLTGLLSVIRMTDPDLTTLHLGTDLTTLGLNLTSTEVLYATFASPCLDVPTRSDPDYVLPFAYYMQPPALKTSHLAKFTLETLFYIFYNMPKDTLQVYAAKELYKREWRYHKELKLWFSRAAAASASAGASGSDPTKKDAVPLGKDGATKDAASAAAAGGGSGASKDGKDAGGASGSSSTGGVVDANTYLYFDINAWSALKWEGPIHPMLTGLDMEGYDDDWNNPQRKANETNNRTDGQ